VSGSAPLCPPGGRSPTRISSLRGINLRPERRTERIEPRSTRRAIAFRLRFVSAAASEIVKFRFAGTVLSRFQEKENENGDEGSHEQQARSQQKLAAEHHCHLRGSITPFSGVAEGGCVRKGGVFVGGMWSPPQPRRHKEDMRTRTTRKLKCSPACRVDCGDTLQRVAPPMKTPSCGLESSCARASAVHVWCFLSIAPATEIGTFRRGRPRMVRAMRNARFAR
jgi:hypothetical protein